MFMFALSTLAKHGFSLKVWFSQNGYVWITLCDKTGRPVEPLIQAKALMHSNKFASASACLDVCGRTILKQAADAKLVQ